MVWICFRGSIGGVWVGDLSWVVLPQSLNVLALVLALALLAVPIVTIYQQLCAERAADGSES